MARTIIFSYAVWCLENSQKLLTIKQFLVVAIFFTNINISFFNLRFDLFSIITKKNQSNQEQCSLCCSSFWFCVLLCTHNRLFQCFSTCFCKLKEIGVLRSIFPDYAISCDYGLIKKT